MYTRRDANDLSALRQAAASSTMLTRDEEQQLARASQQGDAFAFDRLVRAHLPLVFAMAGEYRRFGAPMADLVGEAVLALVLAARRYDPDRGTRLAVYAAHWIKSRLRRFTLCTRRLVAPPSTRKSRSVVANLARAKRELTQALGAAPDREALAEYLGVSVQEVTDVEMALYTRDATVSGERSFEHGSVELSSAEPSPESIVAHAEGQREIRAVLERGLETLGPRERTIVEERHLKVEPPTLDHIGYRLQVSRERVRQLEVRGYQKLCAAVLDSVA